MTTIKCEACGAKQGPEHACDRNDVRRHRANQRRRANRAALAEAMGSIGATKVRGGLGGTFWE